jgi:hypothetical protein
MPLHLENQQMVTFNEDDHEEVLSDSERTMLTSFLDTCCMDDDASAVHYT